MLIIHIILWTSSCQGYGNWQEQPDFAEPSLKLEGAADRWNFREDDDDYYTQPGKLFQPDEPCPAERAF